MALPLPLTELPAGIQRFCDPSGPAPARVMAAKGLVPVRGAEQVTMLVQLSADPESQVASAAQRTLAELPDNVLWPACEQPLHPTILDALATKRPSEELLLRVITNPAASDATVERIARAGSETLCERIAVNEQRLLKAPSIIEALYLNRNTRMSTADRLIELAARNRLKLDGIPAYEAHVESLQGELIPEASDEPLPQDLAFNDTLAADSEESAFDSDEEEREEVKSKFKPLGMAIADMRKPEKIRLATVGSRAARAILVRDRDKQVAMAAVSSPQTTAGDAAEYARSREVTEEVLRYVGSRKEFVKSAEVKHNLVFNPKCPTGIAIRFIGHLRVDELRKLSRNRNVPAQVRSLAHQWLARREKR